MLLGVTDAERFSLEMTALGEGALSVGWLMALDEVAELYGVPRDRRGRMIHGGHRRHRQVRRPRADDGIRSGPLRRLRRRRRGIDGRSRRTDGREPVEAHVFYDRAVEALGSILGDITAAGVVFPVDLRLRPGSKGSGFASGLDAVGRYYREWADPWERQTLTRARLVGGDPRVGRAVRRVIRDLLYGPEASPPDLKEMRELRGRMERELGKESPGRLHVKFGRGGLVDVEFITQALVMTHGARHPSIRRANTLQAIEAIERAGHLTGADADALAEHYRFFRRVSGALRLFGVRPSDTLEPAGPIPGRIAKSLDYPSRKEFLEDHRRRTTWVRALYDRIVPVR